MVMNRWRRWCLLVGLANLVLMPFLFVFMLVYLVFRYGEELHSSPGSMLGARQWTPMALWRFREFNELNHVFKDRYAWPLMERGNGRMVLFFQSAKARGGGPQTDIFACWVLFCVG